MRAAVIFGLDSSEKDLKPFRESSNADWLIGLPEAQSEADGILIFGGDGTIHRHLPRLVNLRLPVLVVPCGSGNDFARALQLPNKSASVKAWKEFLLGKSNVRTIDLGVITALSEKATAGPRYFCCVAGVGLDTEVARRANQLPRWLRGHGGYAFSLLPALIDFIPFPIKLSASDTENPERVLAQLEYPIVLAAFANTPTYGGGMKIAPKAQVDDGQLDLCIVRDLPKLKLLSFFPTVYFGRHLGLKQVEYLQANCVRIESNKPTDVYADGEYVCKTPIEVGVARGALPAIVPASETG
jgi:diacylglycerol kinase (ATP)